jgi:hypothetical protein
MKPKKDISIVRSSAAEYLTFVAGSGNSDVNVIYAEEFVWLSQKMIALEETSVIRNFRITAADGKTYDTILRKIACTRATYSSHVTKCGGCEIWITR